MKNKLETVQNVGLPTHELVYRQLRELILFGEIAPGQAVTIQGITDRLAAGMTPVREAIRRLISEGALQFQGNRREIVPILTSENLQELVFARQAIEPQLIILATRNATLDDFDALVSIDSGLDQAIQIGDLGAYLAMALR